MGLRRQDVHQCPGQVEGTWKNDTRSEQPCMMGLSQAEPSGSLFKLVSRKMCPAGISAFQVPHPSSADLLTRLSSPAAR
ncbi:hypothetical protein ATANTOWER_004874 [Ataeniobius toweri]|uniref:Uncharacterized protein n=1 Tax=Ataeniobius toweri TaxID=208326 RepID=A0ABU7AM70_9TELE|nr:hypothetical protein [Ataeniobius toweri]